MEIKSELHQKLSFDGQYEWGPDVSAYLMVDRISPIDWHKVAAHGGKFGITRMSVGGYYIDKSCVPNLLAAREAGIKTRAVYVVVKPASSFSAHMALIEQGLGAIEEANPGFQPLIYLDDETYKHYVWDKKKKQWVVERFYTPTEINQRHIQVADGVQKLQGGIEPGYYSYPNFVNRWKGSRAQKAYLERFADRFWGAFYPTPWTLAFDEMTWIPEKFIPWPFTDPIGWQFGADANQDQLGPSFGAEADDVDVNRVRLPLEELHKLFTIRGEPLNEEPEDPQEPQPDDYTLGRENMRADVLAAIDEARDEIAKL